VTPHAPQFWGLFVTAVQTPPHIAWPAAQD
jgi:hypothetical protein